MSEQSKDAAQMLCSLLMARDVMLDVMLAETTHLLAAIQAHHDLKHGRAGGRSAAVLSPVDRALYEATGIKHVVLGFDEGSLDDVRRAPARTLCPAAQKIADGLNEALDYVNNAAVEKASDV